MLFLNAFAEPLQIASKEFDNFSTITGFRSHFDKNSGFEFRIIEVDGSSSVVRDPIYLYLVITNNSVGDDLQSRILRLPQVSKINKIQFLDATQTIEVDALFDHFNEDGSKNWTIPKKIKVSIPIKNGKIPKLINATMTPIKTEDKAQ